jgi:hypothetical protein
MGGHPWEGVAVFPLQHGDSDMPHRSVAVSLQKAKCKHKYVMFCSIGVVSVVGSAYGGRIEK